MTAVVGRTAQPLRQWYPATWKDYETLRDTALPDDRVKLFFNLNKLWVDMGGEGINHSAISDLFTTILFLWAIQHPDQTYNSFGRCLIEKPDTQACSPDLVLYVGADFPRWQEGEPRRIELSKWRVPELVGEISDTTLSEDLDEKKHLYAAIGIPEYWVIDVRGLRVFAFQLHNDKYEICTESKALNGLKITLLTQALERLPQNPNTAVAAWFAQQIASA